VPFRSNRFFFTGPSRPSLRTQPAYNTSTHKYTSALPVIPNLFLRACWSGCVCFRRRSTR
ncbi:unnamed protein product, partial [Ectocarpus sp. 13 AM-2016]